MRVGSVPAAPSEPSAAATVQESSTSPARARLQSRAATLTVSPTSVVCLRPGGPSDPNATSPKCSPTPTRGFDRKLASPTRGDPGEVLQHGMARTQRFVRAGACRIADTETRHHAVPGHVENAASMHGRRAGEHAEKLIQQRHDASRRQPLRQARCSPSNPQTAP